MRDEVKAASVLTLSLIPHPSSLIPYPLSLIPHTAYNVPMASKVDEHPDVKKWRDRFAWLLIFDIVVVVAALITGLVVFDKYFKNALIPKNFAQVDDQGLIFRSGQLNEHLVRKTLEDNRIKLVLSMSMAKMAALAAMRPRAASHRRW